MSSVECKKINRNSAHQHNVVQVWTFDYNRHMVVKVVAFLCVCEDFGRMFDNSFRVCTLKKQRKKVEISLRTLIPLIRPGSAHSGSATWDDCGRVYPDELRVSLFPDRFPHYACTAALSAHSDFAGSRVYACLGVTCYLHFWQNDRGL